MRFRFLFVPVAAALALGQISCSSNSQVSLDYDPQPGHIMNGRAEFHVSNFSDKRDQEPTYLGSVRTQIGTPLEYVHTKIPVEEVVSNAFGHGLQARGMLASYKTSRYLVRGEILDLYCQMLVRPYAYSRLRISILDAGNGQILFTKIYTGERQSTVYVPGSGSPIPLLRDLTSRALQDTVDRALDDPDMRSAVGAEQGMNAPSQRPKYVPGML